MENEIFRLGKELSINIAKMLTEQSIVNEIPTCTLAKLLVGRL